MAMAGAMAVVSGHHLCALDMGCKISSRAGPIPRRTGSSTRRRRRLLLLRVSCVEDENAVRTKNEDDALLEDIRRMSEKSSERGKARLKVDRRSKERKEERTGILQELVDKALIADFFFVLFVLAWFVVGLGEKAAVNSSRILDSWFPLWPSLFQPALGFLMAGALFSAASSYLKNK